MRVVIDTNWLISYLIKQETSQLKLILLNTEITILTSDEQIKELIAKIYLPKFRNYFPVEPALEFLSYYTKRSDLIHVDSRVNICRDAKDNFLLALSKDAHADFLITGDNDLLVLKKFNQTIICTLSAFTELYLPK